MIAIDLFSGFGGFTAGALGAGVNVIWAANHWPLAVEFHSANHPETIHSCQDLQEADWSQIPEHDVMLASPACQGHSVSRGKDRPHHDKQRNTAWAVVSCAEYHRQEIIVVENVVEFKRWTLYPSWADAMNRLGYAIAHYEIDAADHGVPQHRKRLFLVLTQSKSPIKLNLHKKTLKPVSSIIEWDNYKWSKIDKPGRSKKTLSRIKAGRENFGDIFVAPYYGSGSGNNGRSIHRPIGTITTVDRWSIINSGEMRMLQPTEARAAMGFSPDYVLPKKKREAMHLLGNAVCPPVATDLLNAIMQVA